MSRWPKPAGGWACRRADRRPSSTRRSGFRRPWRRSSDASGSASAGGGEPPAAASLAARRLALQLDQNELEWLVADIFRQVLSTGLPHGLPSLCGDLLALAIGL